MKNNLTVIMTVGLPASGKTTWSKNYIKNSSKKYVRINKDDIRNMIQCKDEGLVIEVRNMILLESLKRDYNVIIDDTNFNPIHISTIRNLIKDTANLQIKDFTNVSVSECIERDKERLSPVGEEVIRNMYEKYFTSITSLIESNFSKLNQNTDLPHIVICDLDGTLALLNGRNPYDASTCEHDTVNKPIASIISNYDIIFISGREDKYRKETYNWLTKNNFKFLKLYMRKTGDFRKDSIIKREIFEEHIKNKYYVNFVLDDRNQVVDEWRKMGLTCLQVAPGNF